MMANGLNVLIAAAKYIDNNNTWSAIKYIIVTIVFLLLLWAISKLLITRTKFGKKHGKLLKLVDVVYLSQDSYIYILELEGIRYVVASNRNSLLLLDRIPCHLPQEDHPLTPQSEQEDSDKMHLEETGIQIADADKTKAFVTIIKEKLNDFKKKV